MLRLSNLHKTFFPGTPNEVRALRGVDLHVPKGAFLVILGGNGSGKSTLLNAIAGSFQLDQGEIELENKRITNWPEHRRAALIGRVFQNPFAGTAPGMSIAENVSLATRRGRTRTLGSALPAKLAAEIRDRVSQLRMGLEDRLDNPIGSLSGGQRQALTLLMAAWVQPSLLLLDEHTAALDPRSADQVVRLTEEFIARNGLTTLMVTHSMQQAVNLGERVIMMHQGSIAFQFEGPEKKRLRANDLLARFDELRRRDMFDEQAAALLKASYC